MTGKKRRFLRLNNTTTGLFAFSRGCGAATYAPTLLMLADQLAITSTAAGDRSAHPQRQQNQQDCSQRHLNILEVHKRSRICMVRTDETCPAFRFV
jgi:hypothetical protein